MNVYDEFLEELEARKKYHGTKAYGRQRKGKIAQKHNSNNALSHEVNEKRIFSHDKNMMKHMVNPRKSCMPV